MKHIAQPADLGGVDGAFAQPDFETVIVGRIVRSRDHNPGCAIQVDYSEIERRSGHHAQAGNVNPGGEQPFGQGIMESGRTMAAVMADNSSGATIFQKIGSQGLPQAQHPARVQISFKARATDNSPDIISAECSIGYVRHENPPPNKRYSALSPTVF
jgi:hypothetical protein